MSSSALDPGSAVRIPAGDVSLDADIALPPGARGLVLFAHGSGSGRRSPRNRYVAELLRERGLGTVLLDLLTPDEALQDARGARHRFDIGLLARRLTSACRWLSDQPATAALPRGCFGASTGAAAGLLAAAELPDGFAAIVSRGGRPDLAGDVLEDVKAPTLLLVGSDDTRVLEWNRHAVRRLPDADLVVIPGAGHLFEEPGALEQVSARASEWFLSSLVQTATRSER